MRKKDEMKMIPINITDGEITGISIDCSEKGIPEIGVNVSLLDDFGKKITTISITTRQYYDMGQMKVSTKAFSLVGDLIRELKVCAIQYMNTQRKILDVKKS